MKEYINIRNIGFFAVALTSFALVSLLVELPFAMKNLDDFAAALVMVGFALSTAAGTVGTFLAWVGMKKYGSPASLVGLCIGILFFAVLEGSIIFSILF